MPARIVVVHDDKTFLDEVSAAFAEIGYDIVAFERSMTALTALGAAHHADILITRLSFPPGNPNGLSLARMARNRRPAITVLFFGPARLLEHTDGVGEFLPAPITVPEIVETVTKLLAASNTDERDPAARDHL